MRELRFSFRGKVYRVDEKGRINANGIGHFSDEWVFLGGTRRHQSNRIMVPFWAGWNNPELLNGCLGWARDHGTVRRWGGVYCGKLPRITGAYKVEVANG